MESLEQQLQLLQHQLIELQINFTHQEKNIRELDSVIQEQYKEIDLLKQQQLSLIKQLEGLRSQSSPSLQSQYEKTTTLLTKRNYCWKRYKA